MSIKLKKERKKDVLIKEEKRYRERNNEIKGKNNEGLPKNFG